MIASAIDQPHPYAEMRHQKCRDHAGAAAKHSAAPFFVYLIRPFATRRELGHVRLFGMHHSNAMIAAIVETRRSHGERASAPSSPSMTSSARARIGFRVDAQAFDGDHP
jgi:hypothetical protein